MSGATPKRMMLRREAPALWGVIAIATIAVVYLTAGGVLTGQDAATQFYPWYDYLGERLRAGQIPEWNPAQFAGAPFAADPQSGWMYLPAMLFFSTLPQIPAIVAFLSFHLLLAGMGTWLLARLIGISPVGAVLAATAYMGSGVILGRLPCCPASYELASWVPVSLAGAELAIQGSGWRGRIVGWAVTGLALSQVLAVWLGQGAYYVLLLTGAYLAYRVLLDPPPGQGLARWQDRFVSLGSHGAVVLLIGFGLAAAGILPRLEYNAVSSVAGGIYQGSGAVEAQVGGASAEAVIGRIFQPSLYYPGTVTLVLAVAAVVLLGRRHASWFWVGLASITIVLSIPTQTPLHALFYLLPRFQDLHSHWPERVVLVTYIAPAMLAGAMTSLLGRRWPPWQTALAAALPPAILLGFVALESAIPVAVPVLVALTSLLLLVSGHGTRMVARKMFPLAVLLLLVVDIAIATRGLAHAAPFGGFHRLDPTEMSPDAGAARFLQDQRNREGPFRYAGYDPDLAFIEDGQQVLYRYQFAAPETRALLVNNVATALGLEDVQGYNPIQILHYVEYVNALNGMAQEYHGADIYPAGLDSPLLDLLNVRYLIVPTEFPPERSDLHALRSAWEVVYADDQVQVLRNPEALPRAWIVHDVQEAAEEEEMLSLLASGGIDPRRTALVEEPVPGVEPAASSVPEHVEILPTGDPDELRIRVQTGASGFLVLSEIAYPAWRATVDGEPVSLITTNGALRGLPVPAGDHLVELRLESVALRVGLWISTTTFAVLLGLLLIAWWPRRRSTMLKEH